MHDGLGEKILQPYVSTTPKHVVPLLILDSHYCHMMGSVIHSIQNFGVQVEHIPRGCTRICQPVYVGFNKPFKNNNRKFWQQMLDNVGRG